MDPSTPSIASFEDSVSRVHVEVWLHVHLLKIPVDSLVMNGSRNFRLERRVTRVWEQINEFLGAFDDLRHTYLISTREPRQEPITPFPHTIAVYALYSSSSLESFFFESFWDACFPIISTASPFSNPLLLLVWLIYHTVCSGQCTAMLVLLNTINARTDNRIFFWYNYSSLLWMLKVVHGGVRAPMRRVCYTKGHTLCLGVRLGRHIFAEDGCTSKCSHSYTSIWPSYSLNHFKVSKSIVSTQDICI